MKPVLIQTLIKKMRGRISNLPMPNAVEIPTRRDKSGTFILVFLVLAVIATILI